MDSGILGKITLVKPMWNWNVSKPLDNTPLPGKLDWKRFLGAAPGSRPGAHALPLLALLLGLLRRQHDRPGHAPDGRGAVVHQFGPGAFGRLLRAGAKNTGSEVPDVFCAVFEYPNLMATWTLNYCNSYENDWSIQFQGDEGTMILNNAGFRIWKEPVPKNPEPVQTDGRAHSRSRRTSRISWIA